MNLSDVLSSGLDSVTGGNRAKRFEVGATYSCRSIGDHDCVWTFVIASRTPKTVKVMVNGEFRTRRISMSYGGHESFLPFGSYSMAPMVTAEKLVEEGEIPE